MRVAAAVGELEEVYGDRVRFQVVPAEETAKRADEIAAYGFTELRHGLVALDPDGEVIVRIPGHDFGKPEVELAVLSLL